MIFWPIACLIWSGSRFSGQKAILGPKNKVNWKIRSKLWVSKLHVVLQVPKIRKMRIQKSPNLMIFGPIACFRRSGYQISGQKAIPGPKKKKIEKKWTNFGSYKKSWKFKNVRKNPWFFEKVSKTEKLLFLDPKSVKINSNLLKSSFPSS